MPSQKRTLVLVAAALVAALLVTAAGGRTVAQATPAKWATGVCGAVSTWLETVRGASETAASTAASDAKTAKRALSKLVTAADKSTAKTAGAIKRAGAPSGTDGKEIASIVNEGLKQTKRAIGAARKAVSKAKGAQTVPTIRLAQDGLESGLESLVNALLAAGILDTPELLEAFTAEPECAAALVTDTGELGVTVTPAEGAPGTEIGIAPSGVDADALSECRLSSTFVAELLGVQGDLLATGGETILVPDDAPPGSASVRLICYVPDATGRRVIRGLCTTFVVTGAAETGGASGGCPPAARVVISQAILEVESALSEGFNPVLSALGA